MKSGRKAKTTSDPSAKDNKTAQKISVKDKAARGCRNSGTSAVKVSKQRRKTTGNDNGYHSHLPSTRLHSESRVMSSISTPHMPLEAPTPVRVQSSFQIQKFQLQLFPIDEPTRKRFEEENHYPYLLLTIKTKIKIASVIRHLNMKWGNPKCALEELFLFPYHTRVESLESCKRWTLKDSDITAAEVHAAIGKPAVFRLRYGWFNILGPKNNKSSQTFHNLANQLPSKKIQNKDFDDQEKEPSSRVRLEAEPSPAEPLLKQNVSETAPMKTNQAADNLKPDKDVKLSWVDCASNMSFGALLSEAEAAEGAKLCRQAPQKQISISCDSFDAAIAAHILQYQTGNQCTTMGQPSILDAEETCNPFLFHNLTSLNKNIRVQSQLTPITSTGETAQHHGVKLCNVPSLPVDPLNTTLTPIEDAAQTTLEMVDNEDKEEMQVDTIATYNVNNQFEGIDMHWPSSVGPWQFVASSSQQIISSDSNGLNAVTSLNLF